MLEKVTFFSQKSSVLNKKYLLRTMHKSVKPFISNNGNVTGIVKNHKVFSQQPGFSNFFRIHEPKKVSICEKKHYSVCNNNNSPKQVIMGFYCQGTSNKYIKMKFESQENSRPQLDILSVFKRINCYLSSNHQSPRRSSDTQITFSCKTPNGYSRQSTLLLSGDSSPLIIANKPFSTLSNFGDSQANDNPMNSVSASGEKIYSAPKSILHNAYDIVAQQLNNKELKLQPTYNIIKANSKSSAWSCTYNIMWPEVTKFASAGRTKKEASHKAAQAALLWLRKNEKLTKEGLPVIFDKKNLNEIDKKEQPKLILDTEIKDQMKTITHIYKNEFITLLEKNIHQNGKVLKPIEMEENCDSVIGLNQRLFTPSKYLTKEKISLPISSYKDEFIKLLDEHKVVIVKGQPGCGKSTRIPQYVLESWAKSGMKKGEPCKIAVTQPRRIAAISLADRVSDERDESCGHTVGYQVRLKSKFNPATGRILYCTTGILLKYLQTDVDLLNFTCIILDEAHERDANTDLLMNLLKNAQTRNDKLKLIIMSATFDVDLFKTYFDNAPVIDIPGFTYPVKSYFLDDLDSLNLVKTWKISADNTETPTVIHEDVVKLINHLHTTKEEGAILCFLPGWDDIAKIQKSIPVSSEMIVLCLHSRLQYADQRKIFARTPPGVRKVILSTNIAETSITVNDVVYVIDTGIHKENRFDSEKGVACIDNYWISQSNMRQRKGRAGRVQPGECYHLYSKQKYESLAQFADPEILKTSLTKIVLNSKVYSDNMDALKFMSQLPTPPEKSATKRAVHELKELQLLEANENLTALGRTLANFQLEPKLAKILVNSVVYKCVTPVVDIVTIFSSDTELFTSGLKDKETIQRIKSKGSKHSDHLAMMRLFEAWIELMQEENDADLAERFCSDANLEHHKMITLSKLRNVHFDYLHKGLHNTLPLSDDYSDNDELVKAVLFSGVGTLLKHQNWVITKGRYKRKNTFYTNKNQIASITAESVNFKKTSFPSDLLVHFNEIRSNLRRTTLIRECSVVAPLAVLLFSHKDLTIKEIGNEDDKVTVGVQDTRVGFSCSKQDAHLIRNCKEVINSAYEYFIFQMTEGGECNFEVNQVWDKILGQLNLILSKCKIE